MMLLLILSPSHGGAEEGWPTASSYRIGGDRGDQVEYELIQAGGILASAILCRQGGGIATSDKEAIFSNLLWTLDTASPPSGCVPGGLATASRRGSSPEGSQ
jgi:hypothetical protein